jgi:cation transport ATPase
MKFNVKEGKKVLSMLRPRFLAVIAYMFVLFLLLYFSTNSIILAVTESDVFPNIRFYLTLFFMIFCCWALGMAVRKYMERLVNKEKIQMRTLFVFATFVSVFVYLLIFTI